METFVNFIADPRVGAIGVLAAWLWFTHQSYLREREERVTAQNKLLDLQERTLRGLNDGTVALKSIVDSASANHTVLTALKDLMLVEQGRGRP